MNKQKKVLVVGAGIGGLATALRLAKKGFKVQIVEKNNTPGGRLNQIKKDGFTFDTGPSFFSMSYEFEQFAKDCNIDLPFEYHALDPLYTVSLRGNPKPYFLYKDTARLAEQFVDVEPDFEEKMNAYLKKAEALFNDTIEVIVKRNFNSLFDYMQAMMQVNPQHLPVLTRNFYQQVSQYFSSDEARQIISLVAFFLGRTSFDTMAIYTLLSYTEFKHDGYFNVKGGMYAIVEGLVRELEKEQVEFVYNSEIVSCKYQDSQLTELIDNNGVSRTADIFVINADAAVFRGKVLERKKYTPKKLDTMSWTMGYLTLYIGLSTKLPQVDHHNYYLGSNFKDYAKQIMKNPDKLEKPYYYVNVLSKHNASCAPEGCESLFFVCPVPTLAYKSNWDDRSEIVQSILDDFSERIEQDINPHIISKTVYTPLEWKDWLNLHQGSGLGLSHTMFQIGAFRPKNYDEQFANTFYVGASTIPGAGLPMGIISSGLTTERVLNYSKEV